MRFFRRIVARLVVSPSARAKRRRGRMFAKPVERCLGVALLAVGLAGCIEQRRGLGPIIDAASVESASSNTRRILHALALDAGVDPVAPSDWYLVAEAGFNYIDDQCKAYFHEQFSLGSERAGIRSGVTAAGQATAAILSVTGSPAMGLAVLAQALGLGASATDLAAGSYVSRLPPTTTYDFVQRLQRAFRAAAAGHRARINTPTAAYYVNQRYLDLCLPPRIEVEITKQITLAGTVQAPRGSGSLFPVEIASVPSASVFTPASARFTPAPARAPSSPFVKGSGGAERRASRTGSNDAGRVEATPETHVESPRTREPP